MGVIRGRGIGRIPCPTQKLAEAASDTSQQLCAAAGGAGRKNRLLDSAQDGHPGLCFWLQPSRHLPAQCPFPGLCWRIKAIFCQLLPGFAAGALEVPQHSRVLNSPGPPRKLVGLWSQRLLSGFVVEQINYKGNICTPFCQKQSGKKEMSEWGTKMLQDWSMVCSFPVDSLCFEIYKITGITKYHKYSAQTHIKIQNHRTHCTEKTSMSGYFNLSSH